VAGENRELRVVIAVGDRDAGVGGAGDGRADAGDDFEWHAGGGEFGGFLGAAAEDHRVAALEADHGAAGLGFLYDERVDLVLRHRVVLGALADVDFAAARFGPREKFGVDEGIVDEHIGALDDLLGSERDETDVTRSGSDEIACS
jgi:hypothetical protein